MEFSGTNQRDQHAFRHSDTDPNVWLGAAFGLEEMLSPEEEQTLLVPALAASRNSPDATIRANAELFLKRNAQPIGDARAMAK